MPVYASDVVEQKPASAADILKQYKSKKPESDHVDLENQIVQLQLELRETRRKYYAAKTENKKLKAEGTTQATGYTEEQVKEIVNSAQSDMYYDILKYAIGEREFILSLATKEDMTWLLEKMRETDIGRIKTLKRATETYSKDVSDVIGEYKSYYDVNRNRPQSEE